MYSLDIGMVKSLSISLVAGGWCLAGVRDNKDLTISSCALGMYFISNFEGLGGVLAM